MNKKTFYENLMEYVIFHHPQLLQNSREDLSKEINKRVDNAIDQLNKLVSEGNNIDRNPLEVAYSSLYEGLIFSPSDMIREIYNDRIDDNGLNMEDVNIKLSIYNYCKSLFEEYDFDDSFESDPLLPEFKDKLEIYVRNYVEQNK